MKKSILTLLIVCFSLNIWSNGVLKWRLNFENMYHGNCVHIGELELDIFKSVKACSDIKSYCNEIGEALKEGEYKITDPCLLLFQYTSRDGETQSLIVPGIPNEEIIMTGRPGSMGYDITGSSFYNKFHEVDLFIDDLKEKHKDKNEIFHEFVEYIKSHPDNEACAMMIPLVFIREHDKIKAAAKALSPQVKNNGKVKKYIDYLINLDEIRYSYVNLGDFLEIEGFDKIGILGIIIKDDTKLPNKSDMFKLKSSFNLDINNIDVYYEIEGENSNYKLHQMKEGSLEQTIQFERKDGYSRCLFNSPLYLDKSEFSNSVFNEIFFIVAKNEAIDRIIENQINELKEKNTSSQLEIDDRNNSSIKIVGVEKDEYNGREYKAIRYSDGITKVVDLNNNWIQFKTGYKKDEYTGEDTNIPINLFKYKSKPALAADIKSGRYRLVLSNKMITVVNSNGVQCLIKANDDILMEVSKCFYNYIFDSNNGNTGNTVESYIASFPKLAGSSYVVKGPNGNLLEDISKFKFRTLKESDNHGGGYFDRTTNKMYYISIGRDNGRVMQAWSLKKGSTKINSIFDDDILMIDCLPSDTITRFVNTNNVGEIHYLNGDYVKYSKLKGNLIFDCLIHRKDGIFTIQRENDTLVARYDFTSGIYKGFIYEYKSDYFRPELALLLGYADLNSAEFISFSSGYFYNKKTKAKYSYSHGSLYNLKTNKYEVLSEYTRHELDIEEQRKNEYEQGRSFKTLYQKYEKKYVDAIRNNKILIGTPEGLIKYLNSTLKYDSQNTRTYEITGSLSGERVATVYVNKKNKRVSSVSYR